MTFKLTSPSLILTFEGNDLEPGHSTSQTITNEAIINRSYSGRFQRFSNLKSSSDTIGLQIRRKCASTEDIIATQGNIKAVLRDGENTVFTGYISTSFRWTVSDHGEQALAITLESVGTRLFNQPFIETGKHFFRCSASAALYSIVNPLGITIHAGDERKILQDVSIAVEAGTTCRELIDQLLYECNAVYFFNEEGELCIQNINPQTAGAQTIDSDDLYVVNNEAVSLSKSLRAYKGARVTYSSLAEASNYLVYRNTTGQDSSHPYCNLELKNGEYFDGTEIYTSAEWSAAQADEFREPALIGAVNADSESQIVGSGKIVNIDNLRPDVIGAGMTCTFENVGGGYFKLTAHNGTGGTRQFTRMDLYADIVYEKSQGVIRTQIDGTQTGKDILKEDLKWLHDKDNATAHANLLAQYHQYAGATYTFRTRKEIALGSVIKLHEDLYSGLEVYVLVTACEVIAGSETVKYTAVGISTFDLSESAYHGTTQPANQSGAQGPAGEPGAAAEVQYAIGDSIIDPPADEMLWNSVTMEWDDDPMLWQVGLWGDEVPDMERGKYIWMRTRIGDAPWQYTRLTGSTSWDPRFLGVFDSGTGLPTGTPDGLGIIPGDSFTAGETFTENGVTYTKGVTYKYTGTSWVDAGTDNPNMLLEALYAMKKQGVDFSTLNDPNTISWFTTIITDTVIANTIKALQGIFDSIIVSGKSTFHGAITSSALSTTLDDPTPGMSIPLTLGSAKYWNANKFMDTLAGVFSYPDYFSVSGTYPTLRKKGSNLLITSGSVSSPAITITAPRTQRVTFKARNDYYNDSCIEVWINKETSTIPSFIVWAGTSYTTNINAGDVIKIDGWRSYVTPSQSGYHVPMNYSLYDVDSDYEAITFFDANGVSHTYSGYQSEPLISVTYQGQTYQPTALYKWEGMSSATGSYGTTSSSVVSITDDTGAVNVSNITITNISWSSASALTMLDSNGNSYVINTSTYYQSMTGTITTKSSVDSVISVTILPKDNTAGLGEAGKVWNEGWIKDLHYTNISNDSARKLKENITPFAKDALSILRATDIVNYNFISDPDKKQKIGFIADTTPEELSGKDHDRMELDSCVAVLIKAMQELYNKVENHIKNEEASHA